MYLNYNELVRTSFVKIHIRLSHASGQQKQQVQKRLSCWPYLHHINKNYTIIWMGGLHVYDYKMYKCKTEIDECHFYIIV